MKREFLLDYEAKENEEIDKFCEEFMQGKVLLGDGYPPKSRFPKGREPFVNAAPRESIWAQIPLSGSLIVSLVPRRDPNEFERLHGFAISDIQRLVEFSRDTGKIQFTLGAPPRFYDDLDFLDSVFEELRPPNRSDIPFEDVIGEKMMSKYCAEIDTLTKLGFKKNLKEMYRLTMVGVTDEYIQKRVNDYRGDYVSLRAFGYNKIADALADAIVDDFGQALKLFELYGNLLSVPMIDAFHSSRNISLELFQRARAGGIEVELDKKRALPCEVGRFLFQKLSLFPESYLAMLDVVTRYKQEDLERVFSALTKAIDAKDSDLAMVKSNELSTILENVWSDSRKLTKREDFLKYAIPISLATVGTTLSAVTGSSSIEAYVGLLGALGFQVADKILQRKSDSISEKIAKLREPTYTAIIYDFKKKYSLNK